MTASTLDLPAADRLIDDLRAADIHLQLRGIHLAVDAPTGALTPPLVATLRQHKPNLVAAIRLAGPCPACGSPNFRETPIHEGRDLRRDCASCASCGRTWGFPRWNAEEPAQ